MKSHKLRSVTGKLMMGFPVDQAEMNAAIAQGLRTGEIVFESKSRNPQIEQYLTRVKATVIVMLEHPDQPQEPLPNAVS